MVLDVGISDMLSIAQTVGIIGTLLIALFLSKREVRDLSIDIETKVLSDLDEKMHRLEEHLLERPELARVINMYDRCRLRMCTHLMFSMYSLMPMTCVKEKYLMITNGSAGWNGCATALD
jgi:hypothetical protein